MPSDRLRHRPAGEGSGSSNIDALFTAELAKRGIASVDDLETPEDDLPPSSSSSAAPPPRFRWGNRSSGDGGGRTTPLMVPTEGQLERSRRLNSEGLEGLVPRGTELLKRESGGRVQGAPGCESALLSPRWPAVATLAGPHRRACAAALAFAVVWLTPCLPDLPRPVDAVGLSFFLGFGPLIAGVIVASLALYSVFGGAFIHGGSAPAGGGYVAPRYDAEQLLSEPTADPMIPFTDELRL